jgi:hypothetical protein
LKSKPFFPALVEYMMSGPVVGMVFSGLEVVKGGRKVKKEKEKETSLHGVTKVANQWLVSWTSFRWSVKPTLSTLSLAPSVVTSVSACK